MDKVVYIWPLKPHLEVALVLGQWRVVLFQGT